MVSLILKLEGLAVFAAALYFYWQFGGNWILFVLLLLAPDISMIGYLKDKSLGATIYNLGHNLVLALGIIFVGIYLANNLIVALGLILTAHVGIDRFFGFGLKYPTNFKDTHLQRL
jgi:hypothetical protein